MLPFCDYIEFNESYILNKVMHMNDNNKLQAHNTIMRFLEAYFKLRDLDAVLKCVSEDVYSVGTGTDEAVFGKQQFANLLNREFLQIPNSIEYILDGFKDKLCENKYHAVLFVTTKINLEVVFKMRITFSLSYYENDWLIELVHASEASCNQMEGEFYPRKFHLEGLSSIPTQTHKDLLNLVAQIMPGGIVGGYYEEQFPFYVVNKRYLEMVGYDSKEDFIKHIDGKIINSIHTDDRDYVNKTVNEMLKNDNHYEIEYRMLKKDGSYIYVYDAGMKTLSPDGRLAIISVIIDITNKVRESNGIKKELYLDYLTGVLNRKGAKREIQLQSKKATHCIFVMIDLDNFKLVNDIYGHENGDLLLQWLARRMKKIFYKNVIFRIGGDEFGICIMDGSLINVNAKAEQLINEYKDRVDKKYPKSKSSISMGGIVKEYPYKFQDLYHEADKVLYETKRSCKGSIVIKSNKL